MVNEMEALSQVNLEENTRKNQIIAIFLLALAVIIAILIFFINLLMRLNLSYYTIELVPLLILVYATHAKISRYPESIPREPESRRNLMFVVILYALNFASSVGVILIPLSTNSSGVLVWNILKDPIFFGALIYVVKKDKWKAVDLGFSKHVQNKQACLLPFLYLAITRIVVAMLATTSIPQKTTIGSLLLVIFPTAIYEEVIHRSIIQSKLERVVGINKAWFYSGILFGLGHVPVRFLQPESIGIPSGDYVQIVLSIFTTITWGWLVGIMYAKLRNLIMPMVFHYLNNYFLNIVGFILGI